MSNSTNPVSSRITRFKEKITKRAFNEWHHNREQQRNIDEGYASSRNDPTHVSAPNVHSASSLLKCHRRTYYQAKNAPREYRLPYGIFLIGHLFEEEMAEQWLRSEILAHDEFVQNGSHIRFEEDGLVFTGSHDPRITDATGSTLLLTEVKTTKSPSKFLDSIKEDHKAQLHAYQKGLKEKEPDRDDYPTGVALYLQKEFLDLYPFFQEFDETFWEETVLPWAQEATRYQEDNTLPPGEPHLGDYECDYCDYRNRCGNFDPYEGDHKYDKTTWYHLKGTFQDEKAAGFLPMTSYPESAVVSHLLTYDEVKLTPTIATEYPEFVREPTDNIESILEETDRSDSIRRKYGTVPKRDVEQWHCPECALSIDFGIFDWDGDRAEPPECPDDGTELRGKLPSETTTEDLSTDESPTQTTVEATSD